MALPLLLAALSLAPLCSGAPALAHTLLAKAQVDECFAGFGSEPAAVLNATSRRCPFGSSPRVNGAYVFSMARAASTGAIWFGTSANQGCTVIGTTLLDGGGAARAMLLALGPRAELGDTSAWWCEFGRSRFAQHFRPPPEAGLSALTPSLGDWRPAEMYSFDPLTKALINRTPRGEPLLNATLGMRSAGAVGDLVLMGGPNLAANFRGGDGSAVVLFAYRASTGEFLGAKAFPEFSNIRRWFTWPGEASGPPQLFTAVRAMQGARGRVLRWTGTVDAPFSYEEVGQLSEEGGYITGHAGRLFVSSWSDSSWTQTAAVWMSPPLTGRTGLSGDALNRWTRVLSMSDYDPDPVVATTQYFGALASFDGYLFVGTMTIPMLGAAAHAARRGALAAAANPLAAARGIAVFRGSGFDGPSPRFELLYGERQLPAWNGAFWVPTPNKMGMAPLFGRSGFGNSWNTYTWSAEVHKGKLYMGTYDWSGVAAEAGMPQGFGAAAGHGADVWRFDSATSPAQAECADGCGNDANYGVRNMLSDGTTLFVGTANPMNRLARGGWELLAFN